MALSSEDREHAYFKLYYQFVKHAFGIRHSNSTSERLNLKLFFDVFPHTQEKIARFKGFLAALGASDDFRRAKAVIEPQNIAEVLSHEHVVLQGLDIILGSMSFRLNDKHLEKPPGARLRAKKTRAKEELYKQINQRIRSIHPHFNIGASTSSFPNDLRWKHAYRHWKFEPKASELDRSASKRNKKK